MSKFRGKIFFRALEVRERARKWTDGSVAAVLRQRRGDMYVSDIMRIIIAVSLGILLITALIFLFQSQLIPGLSNAINKLFNYQNGSLT